MTHSDSSVSLLAEIAPETRRRDCTIIVLVSLVFFALNVDVLLYGDAALYGDYALRRKITEVTLHFGYYWLLIGVQATIGNLLHVPMQETMVWVNVVCGALAMGVAYLLALELLGNRRDALTTVLILALSGRVINNATSSEMYIPQTLCVLSSFYLFVRSRIVAAGIVAGLALLISPLSAFAYLFFPVFDFERARKVRVATLATLTAAAALVYGPFLAVYGHELFWGTRGLLLINGQDQFDPLLALANFPKYQFKQFTALLLLLVPAFIYADRHKRFYILAAAVAIPHLYIILKLTGEDNVFILNSDFFFAAVLALGWRELLQSAWTRFIGPALLTVHAAVFILSGLLFSFEMHRDYAREMREFATTYVVNHDAVVITDWGTAVALTFFGRTTPTTTILQEPMYRQIYDIDGLPSVNPSLNVHDVFLIDRWKPLPLNAFFHSKESINRQYQIHSTRNIAERQLHVTCSLLFEKTNKVYRCALNAPASSQ